MTRRTMADWQKLLDDQTASGLSIKAYCQQQNITHSNFYKYRRKLNQSQVNTPLIKVAAHKPSFPRVTPTNHSMSLCFGEAKLTLPEQCNPHWLAQLIQALQV